MSTTPYLIFHLCCPVKLQQGLTPAHIARKQHYVAIFDILKTVTTTVDSWEEEREELDETLILDHPDDMREHPVADSDEEGGKLWLFSVLQSPLLVPYLFRYRSFGSLP